MSYVQVDKVYFDGVIMTSVQKRTWAKVLAYTQLGYKTLDLTDKSAAGVFTVAAPFLDAASNIAESASPAPGEALQTSVSITMVERASKALPVSALATLTAANPVDVETIKQLVTNYTYELNQQCRTVMMNTIPNVGNYTHPANNACAGGAQDVISAEYVYLGNAVTGSKAALLNVVAGMTLNPAIVRHIVGILDGRDAPPNVVLSNGARLYLVVAQKEQLAYLRSHTDFKEDVRNILPLQDIAIYGATSFVYEGCLFIQVKDAYTADLVGANEDEIADFVIFSGQQFVGFPHKDPKSLPLDAGAAVKVEQFDLWGEAEIRLASAGDAPLYRNRSAAWYGFYGFGVLDPNNSVKLVLSRLAA